MLALTRATARLVHSDDTRCVVIYSGKEVARRAIRASSCVAFEALLAVIDHTVLAEDCVVDKPPVKTIFLVEKLRAKANGDTA